MIIHDCPLVSRLLEQLIAQCFSRGPAECEDDDDDNDNNNNNNDNGNKSNRITQVTETWHGPEH